MRPALSRARRHPRDARGRGGTAPLTERRDPTLVLALGVVVLSAFPIPLAAAGDGPDRAGLFLADIPLLLLLALQAPRLVRSVARRDLGTPLALWLALCALLAVSLVFGPSIAGVSRVGRALGVLALAMPVARSAGGASAAALALGAVALGETAVAVAQVVRGAPLGLAVLGEWPDAFYTRGGLVAPRGTTIPQYVLAALALLSAAALLQEGFLRRAIGWAAWVAVAAVPVGLTFSRAAALGVAMGALAAWPLARDRVGRVLLGALLAGALVPGALSASGWLARVDETAGGDPDRGLLLLQAVDLMAGSPLVGVGAGRYPAALAERARRGEPVLGTAQTPHDVPALVGAEAGALAAVTVVALLVALLRLAVRGGATSTLVFLALIPFWIFDDFPITTAQGAVLAGAWLGVLASRDRGEPDRAVT